jgi:hypothetical protein
MEQVASFGLEIADPTIPWPKRGSAERELTERDGWERRIIPVVNDGVPSTIESMCRGELSVNLMQGGKEGFAISLASTGYRLSCGGRVFVSCAAAMAVAEAMLAATPEWDAVQPLGYNATQRAALIAASNVAERRGEVMLDRVYPK